QASFRTLSGFFFLVIPKDPDEEVGPPLIFHLCTADNNLSLLITHGCMNKKEHHVRKRAPSI
ncbi:MAG: hypothetical protein KAT93_08185, partial [Desulfuromonadales bacterium]|nr:hypothetical protein [Desulfuromonadales bacterium]